MKIYLSLVISIIAFTVAVNMVTTKVFAAQTKVVTPPKIQIDDVLLTPDVSPVIEAGTTLIPFRALFEALGAQVLWDEKNRLVLAVYQTTAVKLKVGSDQIEVNGKTRRMPLPVKIQSGRTMIPLRTVSEAFGFKVNWDGVNRLISIRSPQTTEFKVVNGQNFVEVDISKLMDVFLGGPK